MSSNNDDVQYFREIEAPRNLAPAIIEFDVYSDDNKFIRHMNVFDLDPFKNSFTNPSETNRDAVEEAFANLKKGFCVIDGKRYKIKHLKNEAAEMITSNMYNSLYGLQGKSVA
jgi:hypothetical protein